MRIGSACGGKGAGGVSATLLLSAAVDDEAVTTAIGLGIVLIVAGILAIELGSQDAQNRRARAHRTNWVFLIGAIVTETGATTPPRATEGLTKRLWTIPIACGYLLAFLVVSLGLRQVFALGVTYAAWAAAGAVLTAVLAKAIFHAPLTLNHGAGHPARGCRRPDRRARQGPPHPDDLTPAACGSGTPQNYVPSARSAANPSHTRQPVREQMRSRRATNVR